MINKVNGPPKLELVRASKNMENDPGASSGGSLGYERPPEQENHEEPQNEKSHKKAKLAIVSELEKAGMTEVVIDFLEHKTEAPPASPGLTNRYQSDLSKTKGLLLNKKVE